MEVSLLDVKYARFAMALDCEGSITIIAVSHINCSPQYQMRITIGNTDKRLTDFMQQTYGGWVGSEKRFGKRKDVWLWKVCAKEARNILELALPYLILKKGQALLAIELQQHIEDTVAAYGHQRLSNDIIQYRQNIVEKLHKLNRKGVLCPITTEENAKIG